MTKVQKKGQAGTAVNYVTRSRALKKLQLSLSDFRRLCIFKGIYPRDPKHKNKIGSRGTATNKKTVYLLKDIRFLLHEPLLAKFRELKAFYRRIRRYTGKKEWAKVKSLEKNTKPEISLDHLVRERYPSFVDALRDLDDPLSMLALFSTLPRTSYTEHQADTAENCGKLLAEFEAYVMATGSLKRAFISIKGIYYQAEILGQTITWVVPHEFATPVPQEVDFKVMLTFLQFYTTLMRFVNYRLFTRLGWSYPVNAETGKAKDTSLIQLRASLPPIEQADEIFPEGDRRLLDGAKIFISREVPKTSLSFILQCLGAQVSWPCDDGKAPYSEDDPSLTHQIVDRPSLNRMFVGRDYVQPQWAFDSLNSGALLDMDLYRMGVSLPPHLSPFVQATEEDEELEAEAEEQLALVADPTKPVPAAVAEKKAQKELAISMMSKKRQKLYQKMQFSRQKKLDEKKNMVSKRQKGESQKDSVPSS